MLRIRKYSFSILYFLNMYISLTMRLTCMKTAIHVPETDLEGRVSQLKFSFYIGLSLDLMACKSGEFQKNTKDKKSYPFLLKDKN